MWSSHAASFWAERGGSGGFGAWVLRFRCSGKRLCRIHSPIQADQHGRNPKYLPLLLGRLRYHPLFQGDVRKGEKAELIHVEGDTDHPTNRGTLCPKGAALKDFVKAKTRLQYPQVREPGSSEFKQIAWEDALDRIARHLKDDRDANFIAKNAAGTTVNRWTSTGFLAASATTNETAFLTYKVVRSTGIVAFDNQARV